MFAIKEASRSTQQEPRYKDSDLQAWWKRGIRDDIVWIKENIVFWEGVSMHYFQDREQSERISGILSILRAQLRSFVTALQNGNFSDEQNTSH